LSFRGPGPRDTVVATMNPVAGGGRWVPITVRYRSFHNKTGAACLGLLVALAGVSHGAAAQELPDDARTITEPNRPESDRAEADGAGVDGAGVAPRPAPERSVSPAPAPLPVGSKPAPADARLVEQPLSPEEPRVTVHAEPEAVEIGEVITVFVTAEAARSVVVNLPTKINVGRFELLERVQDESPLEGERMQRRFTLKLAAFETGQLTVPAIALSYLGAGGVVKTVRSEPVTVEVKSVLANEPEPQARQNAAAVAVREPVYWPLYLVGSLLLAGLGFVVGWWAVRRWKSKEKRLPAPPARPPHEVAFERLDKLSARGFEPGVDHRLFYFEISEILRAYLGGRYGFESLELTTDELMYQLGQHAGRELVMGEVQGWLSGCDLVKFAKVSPRADQARGALETAIRIVSTTRPRPPVSATEVTDITGDSEAAQNASGDSEAAQDPSKQQGRGGDVS